MRSFDHYFLDNRWRTASGEDVLTIVEPVGERPIGRLRACSPGDVDHAVASARAGLAAWSRSSLTDRRAALAALAAALRVREQALIEALADELGAPLALSRMLHLPMPLKGLELISAGLSEVRWEEEIGNARVVREPVGVIAGITPWNAPLHQMVAKVAGAIGAGCAMVLKPSELSPQVGELFFEAVAEAGLPDGVVNLVWGGPEVGEALVEHPGVDMVSFTGSDAVGRQVMRAAAASLKRVSLELGGKSAALVLEDADLVAAVPAVVRQSMANAGQTCVCQSRLLVPRQRLAEAEELARVAAEAIRPGDPRAEGTAMGPVRSQAQFERVSQMIETAVTQGARIVAGEPGRAPGLSTGYFIAPTVLSDVRPNMEIAQEEVFGPVLAILPYEDEEEAVAIANGTRFGLSGAIWSADVARAEALARRLRTGQVIVNGAAQNLATPFGGFGHSGFGRENGRFSVEAFLEYKSIHGVVGA